jgi:hypothetical protein
MEREAEEGAYLAEPALRLFHEVFVTQLEVSLCAQR